MPYIAQKEIGPTGYGLMGLTWRTTPVPKKQAFAALRAALEAGCNFWNVGEFYGPPEWNTQKLLAAYFKEYPEDAAKVVLSVKGGFSLETLSPDASPEGIKTSIDRVLKDLDGTKNIDVFECARIDPNVPVEDMVKHLDEHYVKKGIIGGIALSEVSAATVRRAAKVTKIAAVEVELSLWSREPLENGVAKACAELGIPLVAYSPIGRGILSGEVRSISDIPDGDYRLILPRFQEESLKINLELVDQLQAFAKTKGCTPAQLALSWVRVQGMKHGNPHIIPIPGSSNAARVRENAAHFNLTDAELASIDSILAKFEVAGPRYPVGTPIEG